MNNKTRLLIKAILTDCYYESSCYWMDAVAKDEYMSRSPDMADGIACLDIEEIGFNLNGTLSGSKMYLVTIESILLTCREIANMTLVVFNPHVKQLALMIASDSGDVQHAEYKGHTADTLFQLAAFGTVRYF